MQCLHKHSAKQSKHGAEFVLPRLEAVEASTGAVPPAPAMGGGASKPAAMKKIQELQSMDEDTAVAVLEAAEIAAPDAKAVVRRLRRLDGAALDATTTKVLVKGLAPGTQEALIALIMPSDKRPKEGPLPLAAMFAEMLDDKEASGDLCNVATLEASHGFPTYPPPAPDDRPPPPDPAASPGPPRRCSPLPETIGVSRWKLGKLIGSGSYAASCIRDDFREILTGKTMQNRYRRMW